MIGAVPLLASIHPTVQKERVGASPASTWAPWRAGAGGTKREKNAAAIHLPRRKNAEPLTINSDKTKRAIKNIKTGAVGFQCNPTAPIFRFVLLLIFFCQNQWSNVCPPILAFSSFRAQASWAEGGEGWGRLRSSPF